ncbi:hypothetical protein ACFLQI_03360 [Candidatus Undinarchaeota archaeon]
MKIKIVLVVLLVLFSAGCTTLPLPDTGDDLADPSDDLADFIPPDSDYAKAVGIAEEYILGLDEYIDGNGKNLTLVTITEVTCFGCWSIDYEFQIDSKTRPGQTETATLYLMMDSWEIVDFDYATQPPVLLTPKQCEDLGGRALNIVANEQCENWETNEGNVVGFISPAICCVHFSEMTLLDARRIAWRDDQECMIEGGILTEDIIYNNVTKTWWFGLDGIDKDGCNPACVVDEAAKTASINWRCTGLIIP